jgi:transaldolase
MNALSALRDAGVSIWLDDLSRERLVTGSLERLVRDAGISGVTTNPTIFAKAITECADYDDQLRELAERHTTAGKALRELTVFDVRWACDVLRPVYEETDCVDGMVSIEVDPRSARRAGATFVEAKELWATVGRPNLFVKIPGTEEGLDAITACLAVGLSVNVTLIFSLERYRAVIDAFLEGLEQAHANGLNLSRIHSVASFFLSRVDTEADRRLDELGTPEAQKLRGRLAIANARLAYAHFERTLKSPRWQALADLGARPQRPLWASTSTKDPAYPDTRYVVELVAEEVINTMPEATLRAVEDHGVVPEDSIHGFEADAEAVLRSLTEAGVDYDDVVSTLEREGIATFEENWTRLEERVHDRLSGGVDAGTRTGTG